MDEHSGLSNSEAAVPDGDGGTAARRAQERLRQTEVTYKGRFGNDKCGHDTAGYERRHGWLAGVIQELDVAVLLGQAQAWILLVYAGAIRHRAATRLHRHYGRRHRRQLWAGVGSARELREQHRTQREQGSNETYATSDSHGESSV